MNGANEVIELGMWYTYTGSHNPQLKPGTRVKVLEVTNSKYCDAIVWPMGPARTEDEGGIGIKAEHLQGPPSRSPRHKK